MARAAFALFHSGIDAAYRYGTLTLTLTSHRCQRPFVEVAVQDAPSETVAAWRAQTDTDPSQ